MRMLLMVFREISGRIVVAMLGCTILAAMQCPASESKHKTEAGPPPSARIEIVSLGYMPPSRFYISARLSSASLDFIDDTHLLFTFRDSGLMPRVPNDDQDDEDQIIRAVVLDTASGKVVQEARWRMHDHQRYLWAIGHGEFLVRQRHTLSLTDSSLTLHPYMQFPSALQSITVSPDHALMAVQLERNDPPGDSSGGAMAAIPIRNPPTDLLIVRLRDHTVIARSEMRHAVDLPLLGDGFLEVMESDHPDVWTIRKKQFGEQAADVAHVKSACDPAVVALSNNALLTVACPGGSGDHQVTAYEVGGKVLWQDRWLSRYVWPTFEFAENGSRFAYSSLEINHSVGTLDPIGEDDINAQMIGVFNTSSGKLDLVKAASPILSAGQNYALSVDGSRFAVLREGAIEIYYLPPAAPVPSQPVTKAEK